MKIQKLPFFWACALLFIAFTVRGEDLRPIIEEPPEAKANAAKEPPPSGNVPRIHRPAYNLWSVGLGPIWNNYLGTQGLMYGVMGSKHWDVHENAEILLTSHLSTSGSKTTWLDMGLGGSYFFTTSDFAPLIGADFGFGVIFGSHIPTSGGFQFSPQTGVRFFRTSTTELQIGFRYTIMLRILDGKTPQLYGPYISLLFE